MEVQVVEFCNIWLTIIVKALFHGVKEFLDISTILRSSAAILDHKVNSWDTSSC